MLLHLPLVLAGLAQLRGMTEGEAHQAVRRMERTMGTNRKLKKAIRARMARTGERYTTARLHILAKLERAKSTVAEVAATPPSRIHTGGLVQPPEEERLVVGWDPASKEPPVIVHTVMKYPQSGKEPEVLSRRRGQVVARLLDHGAGQPGTCSDCGGPTERLPGSPPDVSYCVACNSSEAAQAPSTASQGPR